MNMDRVNTSEFDWIQWIADNDRLVLAGLQNKDDETIEVVKQRCTSRLGIEFGTSYFQNLIATFPDRHKDLFPELFSAEA